LRVRLSRVNKILLTYLLTYLKHTLNFATRRSSLGDRVIPSGRRSTGMERVTAQCHLRRAVPLFIPATSENFSVSATAALSLCRGPEVFALSATLILN